MITAQKQLSLMLICDPLFCADYIFSALTEKDLEGIDRRLFTICRKLYDEEREIDLLNINDRQINEYVQDRHLIFPITEEKLLRVIEAIKTQNSLKSLVELGDKIKSMAKNNMPLQVIWEEIEKERDAEIKRETGQIKKLTEIINQFNTQEIYEGMNRSCIKTGWPDFDRKVILKPDDLFIIAARPSMGKTDLCLQLMKRAALNGHKPILFSLETRAEYLLKRLAGGNSFIEFQEGCQRLKDLPVYFDDCHSQTIGSIRMQVKRAVDKYGIDLIMIDYLTLLDMPNGESRNLQVEEITKGLKRLAREFKIPVGVLSQLSRKVEDRNLKMPVLSDLRDSGGIEQNIDIAMFLWRPFYYQIKEFENIVDTTNYLRLILGKQRDGATGFLEFYYEPINKIIEGWAYGV